MRKIKFYFILLFCLSSMLNANSDYIDKTHEIVENYLYTTSDYLDKAISREDYKVKNKTLLSGELSYASVVEKSTPSYNNLKLRIRLLFPRLRDNYKLTLENYNENNSIDNVNQHNRYLLGLTKGKSRVGVKFRGISPDLFISYKLFDDYPLKYQFNFHIENKIMYFVDYKLDNTLQMNFSKMVNDSMRFSFNNSYRFQEEFNDRHKVIHSLNLLNNLDYKSYINYSLSSYSTNDNTKSFGVDYYYAGTSYKNFYYKNWAYYKIDTGLTFRKYNNFDAKARAMIKLGILFGKSKSKFNIKDN